MHSIPSGDKRHLYIYMETRRVRILNNLRDSDYIYIHVQIIETIIIVSVYITIN